MTRAIDRRRASTAARLGLGALAIALAASPAFAQDRKKECATAYEQVQAQRRDGHLRAARERALACSQEACPAIVRKDCAQWLSDIEQSLPTVVFEARDGGGKELTDVKVSMDGEVLKDHLDGKAVVVDPGDHVFRYEVAGSPPQEEHTLIREGDRVRRLSVTFGGAPAGSSSATPATPPDKGGEESAGPPAAAFILAGVGVVGIASFATFGLLGRSQKSDLENTCAPNCSDSDISSVRTKLIVADVSLGVGVVALGIATYLFLAPRSKPKANSGPPAFHVGPGPGAVGGSFGARF